MCGIVGIVDPLNKIENKKKNYFRIKREPISPWP